MNILVTGGLGFIGHNVVCNLEALGHSVVVTDTREHYGIISPNALQHAIALRREKIHTKEVYAIDIADQDGIDFLHRKFHFDTVLHLASFPRQKIVNSNPQQGSRVMSQGLLNLLENSKLHGTKKFVYVSSSMVYGDFEHGVDETAVCCPLGSYAIMKLAGEALVRDYYRSCGLNHTILRLSAVYGPRDIEDRVVSKFLTQAMQGQELVVNGANESLDFTYVDDAVTGIVSAILSDVSNNQTYNIARGRSRTLLEAAELAVRICGQGTVTVRDRDINFPRRGQLDISRAGKDLNYCPTVDIEQGFQDYYQWLARIAHAQ
jgi:UDP-glucose 4-epimerase